METPLDTWRLCPRRCLRTHEKMEWPQGVDDEVINVVHFLLCVLLMLGQAYAEFSFLSFFLIIVFRVVMCIFSFFLMFSLTDGAMYHFFCYSMFLFVFFLIFFLIQSPKIHRLNVQNLNDEEKEETEKK